MCPTRDLVELQGGGLWNTRAIAASDQITVTATEFDQVVFLPSGELPPGTAETYAFNLGGDSEYEFLQPITVSIKNSRNFTAGTKIPLGYWNQATLQWEHEGVGVLPGGKASLEIE